MQHTAYLIFRSGLLICCLACSSLLFSQSVNKDSLFAVLRTANHDSSRVLALEKLSSASLAKLDTAMHLAQQGFALAEKIKFESGRALCMKAIGNVYFRWHNYPAALRSYLDALKMYDDIGDEKGQALVYNDIGNVYSRQSDTKTALRYFRASREMRKKIGMDERETFFSLGKAHEFSEPPKLDSALHYYQQAYEFYVSKPGNSRRHFVLIHLGNVHVKLKNNLLALSYARMAGAGAEELTDPIGKASIYTHMAEIFKETGSRDSAVHYAEKGFQLAKEYNNDGMFDAAMLLSDLYKNDDAKSYHYFKIAQTIQDSIFSRQKQVDIQSMSFNENERQRELSEAKQQAAVIRRNNIQYAAIALGLALFCLLFLLISHSIIVNEKWVKFLGILILLMVFEFLNLILHPYIGELTHHSPVLMLLAMVAIAALLIPTHHHLEHWITQKMVRKNKKVRLEAAKKIVARLEKEEA